MKRAFVIGHPIAHSRSPLIHTHWLEAHAVAGSYEALDIAPADLPAFLARLRAGAFVGGNVTVPHKQAVFAAVDSRDELAVTIGAVNTLVRRADGLHGFNTDYLGFLGNLDQSVPGWDKGLGAAIVLGAGGAARAVLVALRARGIAPLHLLNRTEENAVALAATLGGPIAAGPLSAFAALAPQAGLVVNCSTVGLGGTRFEGLALHRLPPGAIVNDLVYVPLETPLLAAARAGGLRPVDGLGMLLHQAVPGFEAWFGVRPQVTPRLRALVEASL